MKLKSILLTLFALVSISSVSFAQPQGRQSYNFTRALEEAKNGNKADAMDYLSIEVRYNPNNGYAHMTLAILQADAEDYNDAMTSINLAVKKLPKKDKEYTGRAFASRPHLYAIAGDTITALADFDKAIRINLNNVRASVVRNQKAPFLIGQSVLGRLGSFEIDNPGKKLIITHTK